MADSLSVDNSAGSTTFDVGTVSSCGTLTTDTCTGISYTYWPYCTNSTHSHNFYVAHKKENKTKVKLFLICTTCGEGRKIEIPI